MKHNKIILGLAFTSALFFSGCGGEDPKIKQISELQERVIKIEKDILGIKTQLTEIKNNSDGIQYLTPKVQRLQTDLQKVIKGISSGQSKVVNTTQSFDTPQALKQAQDQIAAQSPNLSMEHQKMVALIRSYLTTTPMKDIPQKLNDSKRLHPDDASKWDHQKLIRFIELYKIPKEVKPTP
jgi:peptidoglycan hydrolase CwlO-like protein